MRTSIAAFVALTALTAPFVASSAHAEECTGWFCGELPQVGDVGTATLPPVVPGAPGSSDVLTGTIQEVVPGDHVTLKLPSGELKVLQWSQFLSLQVSGKIVIGGGGGTTAPPPVTPAPPPVTTIVVQPKPAPPPPAVYAPPPAYDNPVLAHHPRTVPFRETWAVGLRLNFLRPGENSEYYKGSQGMRDTLGSGTALQVDLGYRFSPAWMAYGYYEYGRFSAANDEKATSHGLGLGMKANTNPRGPLGFTFDLGMGYRWLEVPYYSTTSAMPGNFPSSSSSSSPMGSYQFGGWDILRLGVGIALNPSRHVQLDLGVAGVVGMFSRKQDSNGGCGGGDCSIPDSARSTYSFTGFTLGGRFDL